MEKPPKKSNIFAKSQHNLYTIHWLEKDAFHKNSERMDYFKV